MSDWLATLSRALEGAPLLSVGAALVLGVASVLMSPCHLAGVPLVVGVVQTHRRPTRSAHGVALRFGFGVLLSFAVVGGLTLAAGRIAGDLGRFGSLLGAAIFIAFGLQLLEVVELPWFKSLTSRVEGRAAAPVLVGFLFGASLARARSRSWRRRLASRRRSVERDRCTPSGCSSPSPSRTRQS